jgi:hypothetical protein
LVRHFWSPQSLRDCWGAFITPSDLWSCRVERSRQHGMRRKKPYRLFCNRRLYAQFVRRTHGHNLNP